MNPKENSDRSALLDKLVDYVNRYLKFRSQGGKQEEFKRCKDTLQYLFTRMETQQGPDQIKRKGRKRGK